MIIVELHIYSQTPKRQPPIRPPNRLQKYDKICRIIYGVANCMTTLKQK